MKNSQNQTLIYCVEDDMAIRQLVVYAASSEGYRVEAFETADEFLQACKTQLPDLIVLDIMLPGMDGITALKTFKKQYALAHTSVIILSAKIHEQNRIEGLDAGADDYVTKPFSVAELLARIRANLRQKSGTVSKKGVVLSANGITLTMDNRTAFLHEHKLHFTEKEFDLLATLMQHIGEVVEREKLLKDIWGYEYATENRTIDIHLKNIREKLGDLKGCLQSVRGVGYRMVVL